jgi:predicted alpha/beta superfamily hydrolase
MIVVGIDHAKILRLNEYGPWPYDKERNPVGLPDIVVGGGQGETYAKDFVSDLIPFIEKKYRVVTEASHRFVGGSSMGALISLYLAAKHHELFSKVIAMSPAVWHAQNPFLEFLSYNGFNENIQIYMDMGTKETSNALNPNFPQTYQDGGQALYECLLTVLRNPAQVQYLVEEDAKHEELSWRRRLPNAIEYLFGSN